MFTRLFLLNFIHIIQISIFKLFSRNFLFLFLIIVYSFDSSHSASISTSNNLSSSSSISNQYQLMSNSSYRNFILRQYFIDLLNISHTSLVRSMIYNHHLTMRSIQSKNQRRKRSNANNKLSNSMYTLQSSNCLMMNRSVQTTFLWSQSIESIESVELIYHIDSIERKLFSIPIQIKLKHSQTFKELYRINTSLQFDFNRDFYFLNIIEFIQTYSNNENVIIETILSNETCQTSHTYLIISKKPIYLKSNQTNTSLLTCRLKTIQIKFEDLGLAYLIIRPKEYTFTYCDGTCSYSILQQQQQQQHSSMHALFQSFINRKNPNIPQPTCVPSQFADDNFLLRQIDGTIEIYPIKDVIVKQCSCL